MALPPIISNSPIFKLFRNEQPQTAGKTAETASPGAARQDVVEISEAAQKKLADAKRVESREEARATAVDTRDILAENEDATLGLDPEFV